MLVLAELLSNESSVIVDLNVGGSITDVNATTVGYGVYDGPDRSRGKFVFINFDYPRVDENGESESPSETSQTFNIPGGLASSVSVRYLLAPNITEQTNISWAGQLVEVNGELVPDAGQVTDVLPCTDGCTVDVPGPGLAVVWLDGDSQAGQIFVGSSTLIPLTKQDLQDSWGVANIARDTTTWSLMAVAFAFALGMF